MAVPQGQNDFVGQWNAAEDEAGVAALWDYWEFAVVAVVQDLRHFRGGLWFEHQGAAHKRKRERR